MKPAVILSVSEESPAFTREILHYVQDDKLHGSTLNRCSHGSPCPIMNFFDQNLEVLTKRYPLLAKRIVEAKGETPAPGRDIQKAVDEFWLKNSLSHALLLCFYGFDLGYHVRHYLEKTPKRAELILIVEKNISTFRNALSQFDWTRELADPAIEWLISEDEKNLLSWFVDFFRDVNHLCLSVGIRNLFWQPSLARDGPYYVAVSQALASGNHEVVMRIMGSTEDNFRGLINVLGNLPHFPQAPVIDNLKGLFQGVPGIVVSTGPSLTKALPYLKEAASRSILFAVDSAASILLRAGITPHFIGSLERVPATSLLFEDLPSLSDTWLTFLPVVYPKTLEFYRGPKLLCMPRGLGLDWLMGGQPNHMLGMTAAILAFTGLNVLGCDPLILVGQDLAFDRASLRSHAEGAHATLQEYGKMEGESAKKGDKGNWVEGNDGTPILSTPAWRLMASQFGDVIARTGKKVYNAIEASSGLRISGAQRIEPSALPSLLKGSPTDVPSQIKKRLAEPLSFPVFSSSDLLGSVQKTSDELARLRDEALGRMESYSKFIHHNLPDPLTPELEKIHTEEIDRLIQEINRFMTEETGVKGLLWSFIVPSHLKNIGRFYSLLHSKEEPQKKMNAMIECFQNWFQEFFVWSARVQHLLEKK